MSSRYSVARRALAEVMSTNRAEITAVLRKRGSFGVNVKTVIRREVSVIWELEWEAPVLRDVVLVSAKAMVRSVPSWC